MKKIKSSIPYIITITMVIVTIVLGSYFDKLYQNEKVTATQVHIYPMEKTFIMPDEVNKLIKVKNNISKNINVDSLENVLEQNGYVRNAEVYKDLNGHLVAEVEQYKPIARVIGNSSYYLDESGNKKPLSKHYTEKVTLIYGNIKSNMKAKLIDLIKIIHDDRFLNDIVSEIHLNSQNNIWLKTDLITADFNIDLNNNVKAQLYKLKAIYSYLIKEKLINKYRHIDLQFENQAVCK